MYHQRGSPFLDLFYSLKVSASKELDYSCPGLVELSSGTLSSTTFLIQVPSLFWNRDLCFFNVLISKCWSQCGHTPLLLALDCFLVDSFTLAANITSLNFLRMRSDKSTCCPQIALVNRCPHLLRSVYYDSLLGYGSGGQPCGKVWRGS